MSDELDFVVVVPARMGSSRLACKVLADIGGKPMAVRVAEIAVRAGARKVVIATDSTLALGALQYEAPDGVEVMLTSEGCRNGTERCAEVTERLGLHVGQVVVNLQGDEPLMAPENVRQVARMVMESPGASTLAWTDPEIQGVTVATDAKGRAEWFSRRRISDRVHMGIYGYRVDVLERLAGLEPCPAEKWESLEQLRWLWRNWPVYVREAHHPPGRAVDTAADLEVVRQIWSNRRAIEQLEKPA